MIAGMGIDLVELDRIESLIEKVGDLNFLHNIKENKNGKMMGKEKVSGKDVVHTMGEVVLTKEDIVEKDFMKPILSVDKKVIEPLNVPILRRILGIV